MHYNEVNNKYEELLLPNLDKNYNKQINYNYLTYDNRDKKYNNNNQKNDNIDCTNSNSNSNISDSKKYLESSLKKSIRDMYINDINYYKNKKIEDRLKQLDLDRKELEIIEKQKQIERENNIKELENKRKNFFTDYYNSLNYIYKDTSNKVLHNNKKMTSIHDEEFLYYKPNELMFKTDIETSNNIGKNYNKLSNSYNGNINSYNNYKDYFIKACNNKNNLNNSDIDNTNNNEYIPDSNNRYFIGSSYSGGVFNNIYSKHKNGNLNSKGFTPNNFFLDNKNSLADIYSKKRTYNQGINNKSIYLFNKNNYNEANKEENYSKINNFNNPNIIENDRGYNPYVYSNDYNKELRIQKYQKQLSYKNGLDFQIRNNNKIRNTPLINTNATISQYKWNYITKDPQSDKDFNIGQSNLEVNPIVNPDDYRDKQRLKNMISYINKAHRL